MKTTMPLVSSSCAKTAAERNIFALGSSSRITSFKPRISVGSMLPMIAFMTSTHSSGYSPVVVSPDSITASARSRTGS